MRLRRNGSAEIIALATVFGLAIAGGMLIAQADAVGVARQIATQADHWSRTALTVFFAMLAVGAMAVMWRYLTKQIDAREKQIDAATQRFVGLDLKLFELIEKDLISRAQLIEYFSVNNELTRQQAEAIRDVTQAVAYCPNRNAAVPATGHKEGDV